MTTTRFLRGISRSSLLYIRGHNSVLPFSIAGFPEGDGCYSIANANSAKDETSYSVSEDSDCLSRAPVLNRAEESATHLQRNSQIFHFTVSILRKKHVQQIIPAVPARSLHSSGVQEKALGGGYMRTGHLPGQKERPLRYLVTGACGQIGVELVGYMRERLGAEAVIASDVKTRSRDFLASGPFVYLDVQDYEGLARTTLEHGTDVIVHLASLLSAMGERNPQLALKINIQGIQNVLELARQHNLKVYAPSSIAVFGPTTPKDHTPDVTVMEPTTMYGITKVHLELLGRYYQRVYGVDFRSLRYPGVISGRTMPGGGTTDYAVEIYHAALEEGSYRCFLDAEQLLPMMYMPDCLKATYDLIRAPRESLTQCVYNVSAMSFTPRELASTIQQHLLHFQMLYQPDFRQDIARTWPRTIDDSTARRDWGWKPDFDIQAMTADMLGLLPTLRESPAPVPVLPPYSGAEPVLP
eukprot:TRINITY_DN9730_c0_g2_i1.p1 TRINITY_DN9730_c0_g2~~TRINITY_DN9730_c0_g2_i1.p1  ORF type:complete len:521 (-),score=47.64 TRINITY_DN9730_c0_g2_i1:1272-2675(-)